jgi:hypothetical protein
MALSLAVPLFYFDWLVVESFIVSKDEPQVRKYDLVWVAKCEHNKGFVTKCF